MIDHQILAEKCDLYSLEVMTQKFMFEYMSCRKHNTEVNGSKSADVNDIFKSVNQDSSVYMFADNTLIPCKSEDITEVTTKAEKGLKSMLYWYEVNRLTINYKKTKYMIIKHTKVSILEVKGSKVSTVQQYEYLGMLLDDKLPMNEYVDVMWKKANTKVGILAKISLFLFQTKERQRFTKQ